MFNKLLVPLDQSALAEQALGAAADFGSVDLIVMTSHGRTGVKRASLGSVADAVIHASSIPVLVLRPKEDPSAAPPPVRRILIPLDGSALAMEILLPALALAQCSDATVVLLHVVPPVPALAGDAAWDDAATEPLANDARARLAGAARCLRERGMASIECEVVVHADVADAIVEFALAHAIDLIALSTHGRGASRLVVGSVADEILTKTSLPLLVHHPLAVRENEDSLGADRVAAQLPSLSDW